eukprot:Em0014g119a
MFIAYTDQLEQVVQVLIEQSSNFTGCLSCAANVNPLCEWCIVEQKCSRSSGLPSPLTGESFLCLLSTGDGVPISVPCSQVNQTTGAISAISQLNTPKLVVNIGFGSSLLNIPFATSRLTTYNCVAATRYNADHAMVYTPVREKMLGKYDAVMMQLRSDGTLGFPGGMVDSEETPESSLTGVFEEEAGDLARSLRPPRRGIEAELVKEGVAKDAQILALQGETEGGVASLETEGGVASLETEGGVASLETEGGVASLETGGVASLETEGGVASLETEGGVASLERHQHLSAGSSARVPPSELEQKNIELEQRNRELKAVHTGDEARNGTEYALSRVSDAPYSAEYVCYLERELAEMKAEKRKMGERFDELAAHRKPPTPPPPPLPLPQSPARTSSADSRHRSHLIALSDTIATLQREKCGLELEMVRLKGREEQLQGTVRLCQEELLRATQVIIALVAEKESLLKESQWLKSELQALHQQLASHGADKQPPVAHRPSQNSAPPTTALSPHGSAQSNSLPRQGPSQPAAGEEVFIRAPPTTASAPPTIASASPTTAPTAPPTITVSTHVDATSTEAPPLVSNTSISTQRVSDFEPQHNNLERLLCHLGHDESHAPSSSCRSSPRRPPAPPLWEEVEVGEAPSQGKEGMGVQGVGVRPLPKNTTTKGPTKLQGRRLVHSKPLKIRNYNNRS